MLAVVKSGAAYLPLDPAYPAARLSFMLRDASPLVLVTRADAAEGVDSGAARVVRLDADAAEIALRPRSRCRRSEAPTRWRT